MEKTELEILREESEDHKDQIRDLENEIDILNDHIAEIEQEVEDLEYDLGKIKCIPFDVSSLPNQMKWEKLCENWDYIKLEDLDAICRY